MTIKELRAIETFLVKQQGSFDRGYARSAEAAAIAKTDALCNQLTYFMYGRKVLRKLISDARATLKAKGERSHDRVGGDGQLVAPEGHHEPL